MSNQIIISSEKARSYFLFDKENDKFSKYQGIFFEIDNELWKIIDYLPLNYKEHTVARISRDKVVLAKGKDKSYFFIGKNEVLVRDSRAMPYIDFDIRKIHDFPTFGREVTIEKNKEGSTLHYRYGGKEIKVILKGIFLKNEVVWVEKEYEYDKSRNSIHKLWIFRIPVEYKKKEFSISVEKSIKFGKKFIRKELKLKDLLLEAMFRLATIKNGKIRFYAGQPWFYEIYSRDELISLAPLIKLGKIKIVKDILLEHFNRIRETGRLLKKENGNEEDADSIFWLYLRSLQTIEKLLGEGRRKEVLKIFSKNVLMKSLDSLKSIEEKYGENLLIYNGKKETWQDTCKEGFCRSGYRIEIQALYCKALEFIELLSKIHGKEEVMEKIKGKRKIVEKKIKSLFSINKEPYLIDGFDDNFEIDREAKLNIFLALYIKKDLFNLNVVKKAISKHLKELWLEWGGLSSISKRSSLFEKKDSGEDNKAYHFGDSWYWINAIAKNILKKYGFTTYAKKLEKALLIDFFEQGAYASGSEISSAEKQEARGCLNQLWTNAMFLESLIDER